eukprot:TRINITY_DN61203_c0_g1_i1.p1 TRINITY_DN61203_c0_g1~~TRINITY_DN61203_c0_g1_i1.p1  ORF type:complete len:423 (-),score=59.82 TRINITY_DN61203_c0_g1_i1:108-1376(-)
MNYFLPLFLLFSQVISPSSSEFSGSPRFISKDKRHTVVTGRNETLECTVRGISQHTVAWIRADTKAILTLNSLLVTQNSRYALLRQEAGAFHLLVTNVRQEDNGTYICQVNTEPPINQEVDLFVVTPPVFTNTSESERKVLSGVPTFLMCKADGIPKPFITWRREGGEMINLQHRGGHPEFQGDILPLGELSPRDSGDYMCVANNGHPPAIVKTIKLNVMFGPEVSAVRPEVFARLGFKAKLVCSVDAYPTPHIWWFKDGTALISGGRYTVDNEVDPTLNSKMVTELEIDKVSHLDWGVYTCKAENRIGNHEAAVVLKEKQERYSKHTRNSKKTTHLAGTTAIHKFPVTKRPNRDREYRRRPHHKVDDDETDEVGENEYLAVNQDNEEINDEYNHYSYFNSSSTNIIYSFIWICLVQIALRI